MMTANQLVTLKASVDKEMKRRCYNGSMTVYAGSNYAFQATPAAGGIIKAQQGNAVIQPLNAVSPIDGLPAAEQGATIPQQFDNDNLTKVVNDLSNMTTTTTSPGCAASCSGLCHTQCSTTCSGCSGNCTDTCYDTCYRSCTGTCEITCWETCSGSCTNGCYSGCKSCNGCSGCTGLQSSTDCGGNCSGTCTSSCGTCTGCSGLNAYT
jgi:hypothetical protein